MSKKIHQVINFFSIVLFILPYIFYNPIKYNYSGILNENRLFVSICLLPNIFYYSYLYYINKPIFIEKKNWNIYSSILLACMVITCFIPYSKNNPISSNIHLLFGIISLVLLLIGLLLIYIFERKRRNLIIILILIDFVYVTTCMSINGVSELIFGFILFLSFQKKKEH